MANSFDICFVGEVQENRGTWRERLQKWNEILQKEKLAEQLDSANSKYVVEFDMKEVENSLRKDIVEKVTETQGTRALWIAKRWWMYRPRLPYTYFLQKLDCSEVTSFSPLFDLFFVFFLVYIHWFLVVWFSIKYAFSLCIFWFSWKSLHYLGFSSI